MMDRVAKPMDNRPMVRVLSIVHFRRLWISQIASQLGANILLFLLALVLYQHTASNAIVSGLFLAYGLPSLLFGMVAGVIVDKLDRRTVLLISHIVRAAVVLLLVFFHGFVPFVYLLVFIHAVTTQFTTPSEVPLIPRFVPNTSLLTANSLFSMSFYSSIAIGFIAAGPLLRFAGVNGAYTAIMALFLVAACCVYGLPKSGDSKKTLKRLAAYTWTELITRTLSNLREGIGYILRIRKLLDSLTLLTGTQVTLVLLGTLGPGFADKVLRIDIRDASYVIVAPAILGIFVGALWVGNIGHRRISHFLLTTCGIFGAGAVLIVIGYAYRLQDLGVAFVFLLFFIFGIANSFLDVPAHNMLQRETTEVMRGRVYGMLSAIIGGVGMLPVVLSGILADVIGVGNVLLLLGIIIFIFGFLRLQRRKEVF